ncbi:MAG: tRNA preQ1(34) S-adenosylmethionine ribosyltransferase-isomerase QueA [Nitrospinae bacterium]|nr:tRNA preQ1(34) S-adenosylmethionine ribosyltransferase-isomerase QueA [Nitrospinota bacterium]
MNLDYVLPKRLIAAHPLPRRDESRLLVLRRDGGMEHSKFNRLGDFLNSGDALVLNETRVIPARIHGRLENGRETEFLVIRFSGNRAVALARGLKKLRPGARVDFGNDLSAVYAGRNGDEAELETSLFDEELAGWLEKHGRVPLPPYMQRPDDDSDKERYQTVFARKKGSCAAPTAGLHFTDKLLGDLSAGGVKIFKVCLHVGPGTFRPIDDASVAGGASLSPEHAEVSEEVYRGLLEVKSKGGRVVAVGTTTTRALETAAARGGGFSGFTDIFIRPGFKFAMVDALVTNFHLPRSSLLSLVCAFAGTDATLKAYEAAIREGYRFYSYGDAMLAL